MANYIYGIDIGGTTVKMGLFDEEGTMIDKWEIVTHKEDGGEQILPDIAASIKEKNEESGREVSTGEYVHNSNSCSMCKRMIINAGIKQVIVRDDEEHYRVIEVQSWIDNDESLSGISGY